MADDLIHELNTLAVELATPRLVEKYGYLAVRDAEILGHGIAAALATVTANPDVVLRAFGGERDEHNDTATFDAWLVMTPKREG